jgi:hypothetical protein
MLAVAARRCMVRIPARYGRSVPRAAIAAGALACVFASAAGATGAGVHGGRAVARHARTAATHIPGGTLTQDTYWTTLGSPYVLDGSVTIGANATLTIDPGVIVKLNGSSTGMYVNGHLSAVGTRGAPIVFTSYQDDSEGGDTNGDGSGSAGSPGQWYSLNFNSSGSQLAYAILDYGGWGSNYLYGAVAVGGAGNVLVMDNVTIWQSQQSALAVGSLGTAYVTNSTLWENGYGAFVNGGTIDIENSTIYGNTYQGMRFNLAASSPLPAASTIRQDEITRNQSYGVQIGANGDYPLANMPTATGNNIYDNNFTTNGAGLQLSVSGYPSFKRADVNWRGNFWGLDAYWRQNPPSCLGVAPFSPGHMAWDYNSGSNPAGPLDGGTAYVFPSGGGVIYCPYDVFKVDAGDYSSTYLETAGRVSFSGALSSFAPQLRYDAQESYRADSAAEITDMHDGGNDFNRLITSSYGYLAASDPAQSVDDLSLSYLGSNYPGNRASAANDYIDEADDYLDDAWKLHADPTYANKMYGRAIRNDDGTTVLQFWFFYYYNGPRPLGIGDHEGDWEMVQYMIAADGVPDAAAYSQHNGGEQCSWNHVQRTSDGHPIVYVAVGSHASYFSSGRHLIEAGAVDDRANGDGESVVPSAIDITALPSDDTGPLRWLWWRGHWGGSGGDFTSPTGPVWHGQQWDDPFSWGYGGGTSACTEDQTYSPYQAGIPGSAHALRLPLAAVGPKLPRLTVRRDRGQVKVRYVFASGVSLRGLELLVSVDSTSDGLPPLTRATRVTGRTGALTRLLPASRGPFRLLVSVRARSGASSRTRVIALK